METYQNLSLEDLPNEIWKDVVGYEGLYQVSNLGRIKSLDRYVEYPNYIKRINGRIMSQQDNSKGYLMVNLSLNGFTKKLYVHRLLAEAFIPNLANKVEVNHIDLNKKNNIISNLEWCTKKENMRHAHKNGAIKYTKVYQYSINGEYEQEFNSLLDASIFHKIRSGDICRSCKGERAVCRGHIFRYYKKDKIYIPSKKFKRVLMYEGSTLIKDFPSTKDASKYLNVKENPIVSSCLRGYKCKGYNLKYKENGK